MTTLLCLLRHGRATGHGSDAALLPEGEAYVAALGRALASEGFAPAAAFASPYRRARDTASIVLAELGSSLPLVTLDALKPETEPRDAMRALEAQGMPEGPVLVVSHLPLVARLVVGLTDEIVDFQPGTFAEVQLQAGFVRGWLSRSIGPDDLPA